MAVAPTATVRQTALHLVFAARNKASFSSKHHRQSYKMITMIIQLFNPQIANQCLGEIAQLIESPGLVVSCIANLSQVGLLQCR